jgi:ribonucleoside-diphosphate reductase alpha chain
MIAPELSAIPLSTNARAVLEKRYLKKDPAGNPAETPEQMFWRVACNIAEADLGFGLSAESARKSAEKFYRVMAALEFLPNSPTLMNAGRDLQQLSACFVLPVEDSLESIFETLKHTALIHQSGGGTGFSFSRLRPKSDLVQSSHGVSSGPVSFMGIFDAATEAIKQGGTRRGANMGILRVDHPDILEFVECKRSGNRFGNFNISVALTDTFMAAVEAGQTYPLINPRTGGAVKHLEACEVFERITELAWASGDPGVIFLDRLNRDNPTPRVGAIESTNPCGEQPLLPYESCNLGSLNLARMLKDGALDWDKLAATAHTAVHFLDNVIEMNRYPLPRIAELTRANRKIGLGVMGFADLLIQLGLAYDSEPAAALAEKIMAFIRCEARQASAALAEKRGAFPNFPGSIHDLPGAPKLRNATLTTIAPTGTISMIAGCSSGIEPLFALCYEKHVMDGTRLLYMEPAFERAARENGFYSEQLARTVAQRGSPKDVAEVPEKWRKVFVTSHEIAPEWHVRIQAAAQKGTDNAVSKTVNLPHDATVEEVRRIYRLAYELGCKGITIYRDGSKDSQVLYAGQQGASSAPAEAGPKPGEGAGHLTPRARPGVTTGSTYKIGTGCGNLYVTINQDPQGACEVFAQMGKSGGCAASQLEAVARMVSLSLRAGVEPHAIREQLAGIRCPLPSWQSKGMVLSCADGIAKALGTYLNEPTPTVSGHGDIVGMCPDCGHVLEFLEGCAVCKSCGYSKCG